MGTREGASTIESGGKGGGAHKLDGDIKLASPAALLLRMQPGVPGPPSTGWGEASQSQREMWLVIEVKDAGGHTLPTTEKGQVLAE